MIVITAPTGQIGRHVVGDLLATGQPLRLIVRDAAKLPEAVRARAEIVEGSHGDAAVVARAFKDAEALFWIAPPDPSKTMEQVYLDFARPAAAAIRTHGVRRVVSVTALGRGTAWQDKAGLVTASLRMDDLLMSSGAAFRGLAMPSFMENNGRQAAIMQEKGLFFSPLDPDRKLPWTATRDMATVAARLLGDARWSGQAEVPVLGPEDLSMTYIATIISDVSGRAVRYQQFTFDQFKQQVLDRGGSESFAQGYIDMYRAKDEGMDNVAERDAESHQRITFREWAAQSLAPVLAG